MMKHFLFLVGTLFSMLTLQAQNAYTGVHKFDGEHKNVVAGYFMGGHNVVSKGFGGFEVSYNRFLSDHWHVGADIQAQFGKQLYSNSARGGYRLGIGWSDFYLEGKVMYNRYNLWNTKPLTFTFGFGVNIRPRTNPWNIGLFFRNYDDFYYENWNINWGLNFYATLTKRMQLFGEFNIRPAGSMSQLASKYETSGKLGLKYVW